MQYTYEMPWGKYRGMPINDIPPDYLAWLLRNCDLQPHLKAAVQRAYERHCRPHESHTGTAVAIAPLVRKWYRRMALEYHPDKRGDHESMKIVNRARDILLELAGVDA